MNKEEFTKLAKGMKAVYTSQNFLPDSDAMKVWFAMLQDLDYKATSIATQKYMMTNKFPPTIADIREAVAKVVSPEEKGWGDAWGNVLRAIGKYGYSGYVEAMEEFDEITRQVVKRLGWKEICMSENISVERANFRMIYEQEQSRRNELAQIPENMKVAIEGLRGTALLGGE